MLFDARQAAEISLCVLLGAAIAAPPIASAQRLQSRERQVVESDRGIGERIGQTRSDAPPEGAPLDPGEQRRIIEGLQQEISAAELAGGPNSPDLIEPLTALGRVYQEDGQHVLAIAATRQALDIVRQSFGLYTLEQAPLIRQLMRSEEAIGDAAGAWDLDGELLALAKRHPDDMRAAPILRETADRRMDILRRYIAGEFPPEIVLGCYYESPEHSLDAGLSAARGEPRQCHSGSKRDVERRLLSEARAYYAEAIGVILRNEQYSNGELEELEAELIRSSYEFGGGVDGKASLRRLLSYQVANSAPMLERIDTLVQMADWDLLYAHRLRATQYAESALQVYEQAYRQLEESGIEQAAIDRIFAPPTPIAIPVFEPNPLVTEQTSGSAGHIDVAFDITEHGRGEHVEMLDTTSGVKRATERDLIRLIERTSFRPRSTDGGFDNPSRVVVRYYLKD
jgi:tetratricopeptide (TPR) repeat protein